jgi:hypothetical protein
MLSLRVGVQHDLVENARTFGGSHTSTDPNVFSIGLKWRLQTQLPTSTACLRTFQCRTSPKYQEACWPFDLGNRRKGTQQIRAHSRLQGSWSQIASSTNSGSRFRKRIVSQSGLGSDVHGMRPERQTGDYMRDADILVQNTFWSRSVTVFYQHIGERLWQRDAPRSIVTSREGLRRLDADSERFKSVPGFTGNCHERILK